LLGNTFQLKVLFVAQTTDYNIFRNYLITMTLQV